MLQIQEIFRKGCRINFLYQLKKDISTENFIYWKSIDFHINTLENMKHRILGLELCHNIKAK